MIHRAIAYVTYNPHKDRFGKLMQYEPDPIDSGSDKRPLKLYNKAIAAIVMNN